MITPLMQRLFDRGFEEGRRVARQECIVRILTIRFGSVTPELCGLVNCTCHPDVLDALFHLAIKVESMESFMRALG